jgi:hypothetical protein
MLPKHLAVRLTFAQPTSAALLTGFGSAAARIGASVVLDFWGEAVTVQGGTTYDHGLYRAILDNDRPVFGNGSSPEWRPGQILVSANTNQT